METEKKVMKEHAISFLDWIFENGIKPWVDRWDWNGLMYNSAELYDFYMENFN
jgi:hypothetical protein